MPRHARICVPGFPYHLMQRGNNRANIFHDDRDRLKYLGILSEHARSVGVAIHAYVLMSNHTHLLVTPAEASSLFRMMKPLGQLYAQWFNWRHDRVGTLWQGRYKSSLVDSEAYLLTCHRYIECNPVRAGMVSHHAEYRWSSYRANARGEPDRLLTPHDLISALGDEGLSRQLAYRQAFAEELSSADLDDIRRATRGNYALARRPFADALALRVGPGLVRRRPGPRKFRDVPRSPSSPTPEAGPLAGDRGTSLISAT